MRILAPWTQENPIFFHMVNASSTAVRELLDQMADVGFEMMIYSFWTGFDLTSTNATYLDNLAADGAYANRLGIEVGGYYCMAMTQSNVPSKWIAINDKPYKSACLASGWYDNLLNFSTRFLDRTGLTMLETDCSYGDYPCRSVDHEYHWGEADSHYQQDRIQGLYNKQLRARGVYVNQPSTYFMQGANKGGMGYDEMQYSLPR